MVEFIVTSEMRCPHFCGEDSHLTEHDAKKISALISAADKECRLIANLGNIIDSSVTKEQASNIYLEILRLFKDKSIPFHTLMGKNDHTVFEKTEFKNLFGYAMRYRAFEISDYRCIFLDVCHENEQVFYVDDEQFSWLSRLLGKSHRPAIIFSHAPLALNDESDESCLVKNRAKLRELFESSNKVVLVISAHGSKQDRLISNGVPYVTLAPIDSGDSPSFAHISISSHSVEIKGAGSQESFSYFTESTKKNTCILSCMKNLFRKN